MNQVLTEQSVPLGLERLKAEHGVDGWSATIYGYWTMIAHRLFLALIFLTFAFFGCTGRSGKHSAAQQAVDLAREQKAVIVDVRETSELAKGRVEGALSFPTSKVGTPEWEKFVASLPKHKKIFTYCAAGRRAKRVALDLNQRGLTADSAGGLEDLRKAGARTVQ